MERIAPSRPNPPIRAMIFVPRLSDAQPDEPTGAARALRAPRGGAGRTLEARLGLLGVPKGGIWGSQPSRRRKRRLDA
jgi:hypothetical protein